jgi:sigma-B regulation protein RsbU (phosphoserine phosphatase)
LKNRSEDLGQIEFLASIGQSFASDLDLDDTLAQAVAQVREAMDADAASVFLLENGDRDLTCRVCVGPINITGLRLSPDTGIVGRSIRTNRTQIIRDVRADPDFTDFADTVTGYETRSILCAPLAVKNRPIGCIEILNKRSSDGLFDDSDRALLAVLASSASLAIHNARMAIELLQQERMRKELELAREIQMSLLPAHRPTPFPIHGINTPALGVSGDFYDWVQRDDGEIMFSLGDVSGKGMNAALLMAKTTSLLHCLGKTSGTPGGLLQRVNQEICECVTRGMFVTVVVGFFNPQSRKIRWSNAGHPPLLTCSRNGAFQPYPAEAPPLGIFPDTVFPEHTLTLGDDILYLYSDGITEGYGADGHPIELEGLIHLLRKFSSLDPMARLEAVVKTLQGPTQELRDDATILLVNDRGTGYA